MRGGSAMMAAAAAPTPLDAPPRLPGGGGAGAGGFGGGPPEAGLEEWEVPVTIFPLAPNLDALQEAYAGSFGRGPLPLPLPPFRPGAAAPIATSRPASR